MSLLIKKFSATWCAPCRMLAPIVERVVAGMDDVTLEEIDIDEQGDQAAKMGISSVPTLVFVKDGRVVGALVGLHQEHVVREKIEQYRK